MEMKNKITLWLGIDPEPLHMSFEKFKELWGRNRNNDKKR